MLRGPHLGRRRPPGQWLQSARRRVAEQGTPTRASAMKTEALHTPISLAMPVFWDLPAYSIPTPPHPSKPAPATAPLAANSASPSLIPRCSLHSSSVLCGGHLFPRPAPLSQTTAPGAQPAQGARVRHMTGALPGHCDLFKDEPVTQRGTPENPPHVFAGTRRETPAPTGRR